MRFKILKIITGGCLLLLVILIGCVIGNLTINVTPSFPLGVYQCLPIQDLPTCKNQLVLVCPDPDNPVIRKAVDLKILQPGSGCPPGRHAPLMKKLVGIPGDQVAITDQGVSINGQSLNNSKIKCKIFELLIHPGYTHTLQTNEYWIMSDYNPDSLDSRYFGPVSGQQIKQYTKPVFTLTNNKYSLFGSLTVDLVPYSWSCYWSNSLGL